MGPVELRIQGGAPLRVGSTKRRAILAALALEANRIVPAGGLIEMVWEGEPPRSARTVLQGHVAQLRGMFDDTVRIVTRDPGYVLETDPDLIDVFQHQALMDRAADAEDPVAVGLLRQAL